MDDTIVARNDGTTKIPEFAGDDTTREARCGRDQEIHGAGDTHRKSLLCLSCRWSLMIVMALARSSGGAYVVVIVEYIGIHAAEWKRNNQGGGKGGGRIMDGWKRHHRGLIFELINI